MSKWREVTGPNRYGVTDGKFYISFGYATNEEESYMCKHGLTYVSFKSRTMLDDFLNTMSDEEKEHYLVEVMLGAHNE